MTETVVGVDVSVRRGLDAVVLDGARRIALARAALDPDGLRSLLEEWRPMAVAIDSPPGPGRDPASSSRRCERALRELGVNIFLTPSDPEQYAGPFYDWIRVGAQTYRAARDAGYPLQNEATLVRHRAFEVFPHASDVFLRGCVPPAGTTRRARSKRAWRLATLHAGGVNTDRLDLNRTGQPTMDAIDAALAAVTADYALRGDFSVVGDGGEWIVVPGPMRERFSRSTTTENLNA